MGGPRGTIGCVSTWYSNPPARGWTCEEAPAAPRDFHRGLRGYRPTPLVELPSLAAELGVKRLLVKDESSRLGLPAFKVLGASWACRQVLDRSPGSSLVTATDGNHGRAVAHMARRFGTSATVFVPEVMLPGPEALIESEGATVVRVDGDYDTTVRAAAAFSAEDDSRALVQDTAWPGYEDVPGWIVQGYVTLLEEVDDDLGRAPDLIVVPTGVGSLTQAVVAYSRRPDAAHPSVLSVEPDTAACLLRSLVEGRRTSVATADTIMAGLNCGSVSTLAWPVLRDGCDAAVTVTDDESTTASEQLNGLGVSSGPCGAASLAAARQALEVAERRTDLGLPDDAVVVLLSTEGRPQRAV